MPELIRALQQLIPARIGCFLYTDTQGRFANIYWDSFSIVSPALLSADKNPIACCLACKFHKTHCAGMPDPECLSESLQPFNHHFILNTPIFGQKGVLGVLQLYRCAKVQPAFNSLEQHQLKLLIPDIALGVQSNRNQRGPFDKIGDNAMVICSRTGNVLQISSRAEKLLFLASHPLVTPEIWHVPDDHQSTLLITMLCHSLLDSRSLNGELARFCVLQNNWGRFCFHVYGLEPFIPNRELIIGITVERYVPLALRLVKAIHALRLSPRQKQVCMLMTYSCSNQIIAERLKISLYTVADFVKSIYERLDVHNRDELLTKLKAYKHIEPIIIKLPQMDRFQGRP